ncbi:phenylalanine--tRNA ligase subunit alpha [Gammaproteobacteria bacterium]|nr:phenylalanine--tRNA ligase subunit alpha [Gammaproteobacteria bacterium]MDC1414797.1 phenylalanine--tRNA ligase subunit alpha [Gammaproteobacteria bacterium]
MQIPQDLIDTAKLKLKSVQSEAEFFQLRAQFLGKKSFIISAFSELKGLDPDLKVSTARDLNILKVKLTKLFEDSFNALDAHKQNMLDVSLPEDPYHLGSEHPISKISNKVIEHFSALNYQIFSGNEIETDYYNFEALNFPENHPARQMHDTFYLNSDASSEFLLRTHTSNTQIHSMLEESMPLYMLSPGRVYRCDSDNTHLPMFTQIEGLVVDVDLNFGDLKGTIIDFLENFFNERMDVRFRPSYFPFTEPSAEVDIKFGNRGWLEILGCGMVHPNVLQGCNIDTNTYRGFAFGMGVERLAMLYYGVNDIRDFYSSNLDFLNQFKP